MDSRVIIKQCTFDEFEKFSTFDSLIAEYAAECGIKGLPEPKMKMETYKTLEQKGIMRLYCAFSAGLLIGFIVVLFQELPHYSNRLALSESFFVGEHYRKTGAGIKLLQCAEAVARETQCCGLLVSAPFKGRLAEVLPRVGYTETNRVFFKKV